MQTHRIHTKEGSGVAVMRLALVLLWLWSLSGCERGREPQQEGAKQQAEPAVTDVGPITRVELASATIPAGREKPHLFKLLRVSLPPGKTMSYAGAERLVFQISGSQAVTIEGQTATLKPDQGIRIETGLPAEFSAQGEEPSLSLHYLLVPEPQADRTIEVEGGDVAEIYRTPEPVTNLAEQPQVLTLTHLSMPSSTPANAPHFRTGAALYYVLSGTGQFTSQGTTEAKQPGSVVYEPSGMTHQWANPGHQPLVLVVANVTPEGKPAIQFDTAQAEPAPAR